MKRLDETLNDQELKVIRDTLGQLSEREEKLIVIVSEIIHARTMNIAKNVNEHAEKLQEQTEERLTKIEERIISAVVEEIKSLNK